MDKPKDIELTEDQQVFFEGWDWASDDQDLPPPDIARLTKLNKKKSNNNITVKKKRLSRRASINELDRKKRLH